MPIPLRGTRKRSIWFTTQHPPLMRSYSSVIRKNVSALIINYPFLKLQKSSLKTLAGNGPLFGRPLREQHFLFEKDYMPLNHGSFGAFPKPVRDKLVERAIQSESQPDTYIRYEFPVFLEESRETVAKLLRVEPSSVVFLPNGATAGNTILRSMVWEKGDVILTCSLIYSGFDKTVEYIVETTPAETEDFGLTWPLEDDEVVSGFETKVKEIQASGRRVRMAIYDTISSMPGIRVPFEKLTQKCKELGVLSFVDGAQGIGQISIDLSQIQPDFFLTNIHKWYYVPRGCTILHVPKEKQHLIRSSIPTSHGFKPRPRDGLRVINNPFPPAIGSDYQELFGFVGTSNNDPYIMAPTALKFREEVCGGDEAIIYYCTELARKGGDRAAEAFGTEVLDNGSKTLRRCAFANVRLPIAYGDQGGQTPLSEIQKSTQFIATESVKHKSFFAVSFWNGALWWRISAQAYLEMADFEWGIQLMKVLCDRINKGDYHL